MLMLVEFDAVLINIYNIILSNFKIYNRLAILEFSIFVTCAQNLLCRVHFTIILNRYLITLVFSRIINL